jgi:hypothetical protein
MKKEPNPNFGDKKLAELQKKKVWVKVTYRPPADDKSFKPNLGHNGIIEAVGFLHSWDKTYIFLKPAMDETRVIDRRGLLSISRIKNNK